jgi:hypothetical protein
MKQHSSVTHICLYFFNTTCILTANHSKEEQCGCLHQEYHV